MREHGCYPVFLDAQLVDRYYNGFCNDVLWPLFHYVPLPAYQAGAEKKFDARLWEAYKEANARFADAVLEVWSAGPPTENDSTATSKVPDHRLGPRLPLDASALGVATARRSCECGLVPAHALSFLRNL